MLLHIQIRLGFFARASTNNLTPTTEMYSSQYIHTYSKLNLSPSISSGGSIDWGIGKFLMKHGNYQAIVLTNFLKKITLLNFY